MGNWMLESHDLEQVFLGEFFWFSAYGNSSEFSGYSRWTRGDNERIPKDVLVTADGYSSKQWDYDCSLDESIHMYLPAGWLIRHIGLRWNGVEEQFFDENGNLVAFDPSVRAPGHTVERTEASGTERRGSSDRPISSNFFLGENAEEI